MPSIIRVTKNDLPALLPQRTEIAHKQDGGKCLIIAGSTGLWGATFLCGLAAYRVGAGYVYLPEATKGLNLYPDFVSVKISAHLKPDPFSAIAIGPGLILTPELKKVFQRLEKKFKNPVIVDAGALALVKHLPDNWIITPHEGEMAKLLKTSVAAIRSDRFKTVRLAQKTFGGIVILKGHHTLIANDKNTYEIQTGNKALAKAGSGDVLTGMIAGFLSQGLKPINAAVLACGLHGYIADRWIKDQDYVSIMASDLINLLPRAIFALRKKI
ncbi:MAG: NAD(P)H-hydrate dehydratase [Bdellovibrionota bacterium]